MGHPPEQPTTKPACSDSRFPPVLDALVGVAAAVGTLMVFAVAREGGVEDDPTGLLIVGAATTIAFAGSAVVGFHRASRCEAATWAWHRR